MTAPLRLPQHDKALSSTVRCHCRFVQNFEAVQLAFMAWKWAWALLLCIPFIMGVVLPEHPEKLHRVHWRATDCGLEAFVMFGLGHMVRRPADIWHSGCCKRELRRRWGLCWVCEITIRPCHDFSLAAHGWVFTGRRPCNEG